MVSEGMEIISSSEDENRRDAVTYIVFGAWRSRGFNQYFFHDSPAHPTPPHPTPQPPLSPSATDLLSCTGRRRAINLKYARDAVGLTRDLYFPSRLRDEIPAVDVRARAPIESIRANVRYRKDQHRDEPSISELKSSSE